MAHRISYYVVVRHGKIGAAGLLDGVGLLPTAIGHYYVHKRGADATVREGRRSTQSVGRGTSQQGPLKLSDLEQG